MENLFPRKNRIDLNTKAELAIINDIQEVEALGASTELTEIVIDLNNCKEKLGNYIDKQLQNVKIG